MKQFTLETDLLEQAKPLFSLHQNTRDLISSEAQAAIGASRLFAYVQGADDPELASRLTNNFTLFRTYKSFLANAALRHIPMAIAASSEEYPKRELEGCIIRIQEARAESFEVYLIIEFKDRTVDLPHYLHLSNESGETARLDLPEGRNGIIQTILAKSSKAADLFKDPKTELYLT